MRYRKPFILFKRKVNARKSVYYYRVFDDAGNLIVQKSTGQTTKTAAESYCMELHRRNLLVQNAKQDILFKVFAKNWFVYDKCQYIKSRLNREFTFSHMYADIQRMNLRKHILPEFGKNKVADISESQIETWLFALKAKGLENTTINHCLSTLRVMLEEAMRQKIITANPCKLVRRFKKRKKKKGILTKQEFISLFDPAQMRLIWIREEYYIANLLAASTGMRLGEIQALRPENVHLDCVFVVYSWDRKYGLKGTKTNESRTIPIYPALHKCLQHLSRKNPDGFLFSATGGKTPLYCKNIATGYYKALINIGISEEDRKKRNITFHSWRHFFNSMMRGKIADFKLQKLTGHKSQEMTEHYTQALDEDFFKLKKIQEDLFFVNQGLIENVVPAE